MTFGSKLKKLRTENNLTQEELAEKLLVTRTAVSKWETDKGYPSIDSFKMLAELFHTSIDELISDDDIENQKLLEERRGRQFYWGAMGCLALTVIAACLGIFMKLPLIQLVGTAALAGYLVCAILSKPRYKRLEKRKFILSYVISRLVILLVVIAAAIGFICSL